MKEIKDRPEIVMYPYGLDYIVIHMNVLAEVMTLAQKVYMLGALSKALDQENEHQD